MNLPCTPNIVFNKGQNSHTKCPGYYPVLLYACTLECTFNNDFPQVIMDRIAWSCTFPGQWQCVMDTISRRTQLYSVECAWIQKWASVLLSDALLTSIQGTSYLNVNLVIYSGSMSQKKWAILLTGWSPEMELSLFQKCHGSDKSTFVSEFPLCAVEIWVLAS